MVGADDLLQDVIGLGSPDERLGITVMHGDVFLHGGDEFGDAVEYATAQSLGGEVAEEALDHVQPRGRGWREVNAKARMLLQPLLDLGMFVRGVVVTDQMQRPVAGRLAIDLAQKVEPLGVPVALLAASDERTVERVQSGELRWWYRGVCSRGSCWPHVPSSTAVRAGSDPTPALGSSRRSTVPAHARAGIETGPQCLRASRQILDHARL